MKLLNYWKPALMAGIIFYGSFSSNTSITQIRFIHFPHSDKLIHFCFYCFLSILFLAAFNKHTTLKLFDQKIISGILVISYGLIIEVFQFYFTNNRSGELLDAFANTLGCILGLYSLTFLKKTSLFKYL